MYYGDATRDEESSAAAYGSTDRSRLMAMADCRLVSAYYEEENEGPPTPKARITADQEILDELDPRAYCQYIALDHLANVRHQATESSTRASSSRAR